MTNLVPSNILTATANVSATTSLTAVNSRYCAELSKKPLIQQILTRLEHDQRSAEYLFSTGEWVNRKLAFECVRAANRELAALRKAVTMYLDGSATKPLKGN